MAVYVSCGSDGRIGACTEVEKYAIGMSLAEQVPDEWGQEGARLIDFVFSDGAISYDPLPKPDPPEDPLEVAREAKATADEAKQIAEQAGTDPQLQALATVQVATMDLTGATSDEVVSFRDYWPEWAAGVAYKHNQPLRYNGKYYRVSKDLTSQAIYPPGTAESEYYEVELAPDGIIIFKKPGGAYNQIIKGELRHYPDADGPVYRALANTTYSPEEYPQHWEQVNA